jgi:hypothetical protein
VETEALAIGELTLAGSFVTATGDGTAGRAGSKTVCHGADCTSTSDGAAVAFPSSNGSPSGVAGGSVGDAPSGGITGSRTRVGLFQGGVFTPLSTSSGLAAGSTTSKTTSSGSTDFRKFITEAEATATGSPVLTIAETEGGQG